jgi:hypothetical protein
MAQYGISEAGSCLAGPLKRAPIKSLTEKTGAWLPVVNGRRRRLIHLWKAKHKSLHPGNHVGATPPYKQDPHRKEALTI